MRDVTLTGTNPSFPLRLRHLFGGDAALGASLQSLAAGDHGGVILRGSGVMKLVHSLDCRIGGTW